MTNIVTYISLIKIPYLRILITMKPVNKLLSNGTWDGSLSRGLMVKLKPLVSINESGKIIGEFTDNYGKWTVYEFDYATGEIAYIICICNVLKQ